MTFLIFRKSWGYLFNDDPGSSSMFLLSLLLFTFGYVEVVALVASIIPLVALFQVFDGTSAVAAGILRARGKQVRRDLPCVTAA